jgi:DNA polymerase I-like protein with 3'-5' exonuclease and polymerase domains|tara:strand:- start:224 stop:2098 length:1875 start_codon:yes stop_codon:yes gene_type:complete
MKEQPNWFPKVHRMPSEWVQPDTFPDLSQYEEIAIDLETRDPGIKTTGPGYIRKHGEVVGIAVAVEGWKGYYPIAHETPPNMDKELVTRWLRKQCSYESVNYIFHNAFYDVGWLTTLDIDIKGKIIDTLIAAPLVDENRFRFDLNSLAKDYLQESKSEAQLYEAAKMWGLDPKGEMWKLPASHVGDYAEQDAAVTLRLYNYLKIEIQKQNLQNIFELETDLFPALFEMKRKGVKVDLDKAEVIKNDLQKKENKILQAIKKLSGTSVEVWAAASVAKAFDALQIPYDRTPTGQPKFDKNFLSSHDSSLAKMVVECREINKARTTFIDTILKHSHRGRIHAEIHQMRSDQGGTVTGRFSYSNPNLQQIPARNAILGPMIRSLFIPEKDCQWGIFDYSQQEPRIVVHYASLKNYKGAGKFVDAYNEGETDFHQIVAKMADIPRKQAKTINLGLFYGMGKGKLMSQLGVDYDTAGELLLAYNERVPFVKQLMNDTMKTASKRGYLHTPLGRRFRFDLWEPSNEWGSKALPLKEAQQEYGEGLIKRAWTYKALNRLIQGSAADQTKKAMVDLYKEGYTAHIQVHDELDFSIASEKDSNRIKDIMENCVELAVPSKVDVELGESWGDAGD